MKRFIIPFLMLLSLSACFEDKGALVAECRLKYENNSKLGSDEIANSILLCMREKGYVFTEWKMLHHTDYEEKFKNLGTYENASKNIEPLQNPCYATELWPFHIPNYAMESCYQNASPAWWQNIFSSQNQ